MLRRVRGKAISIIYSECVFVALVIQLAKLMDLVVLLSMTCLVVPYFSILYHKCQDFRKQLIGHEICASIFYTSFV